MSGRRRAFEACVALALGAASAAATVPLARMTMTAITDSTEVFLVRGNHESRNMTESFTFREEVLNRYD